MTDYARQTLAFYAREARDYAARERFAPGRSRSASDITHRMKMFLAALPAGGSILELGCGSGQDTLDMRARGFVVRPTDGCTEMAAEAAARLGHNVDVLRFQDLDETEAYDGIWASASLLHVPRDEFADVLARIAAALKPSGHLYASFKGGTQEGQDQYGRYYNYPDRAWLEQMFAASGVWARLTVEETSGTGYDDKPTEWLHVLAVKA